MNRYRNALFYFFVTGIFSTIIYWIILKGKSLEIGKIVPLPILDSDAWQAFTASMMVNFKEPVAILLIQILTVITVARFFGFIFKKIGQPSVIGEIIAGIVLGPSVFGDYFPEISATLFPIESLENLNLISQIGLILFMFVIGMELDISMLRKKANNAIIISHSSIIIPFALGIGLSYFIYDDFAPAGTKFLSFSLFLGISMSITAFPVLARIAQERGLHKTKLGAIIITSAASDDITAWCLLAVVIAIVKAGSFVSALYVISAAVSYVLVMIFIIKPFLKRVGDLSNRRGKLLSKSIVAIFFIILMISSYATQLIGIHALFGAFMTGAIMPNVPEFRTAFIEKIEDISVIMLLPLFFVFTGLRTEVGLINDLYLMQVTGLIILVAVVGKFLGGALTSRFVGQTWRDSFVIGALMNTRGLMELIVLNIGLELGVLTPKIFTMMVIMALVTTFMTGPTLDFIDFIFKSKKKDVKEHEKIRKEGKFRVLISFENCRKAKSMLKLANSITKNEKDSSEIIAMNLTESEDMHSYNMEVVENKQINEIAEAAKALDQKITTVFKASVDIETDIIEMANEGEYNLLIVALKESIYHGTFLGKVIGVIGNIAYPKRIIDKFTGKERLFEKFPFDDTIKHILTDTKLPLGIFIENKLEEVNNIVIPIFDSEEIYLLEYAKMFIHNNESHIIIKDVNKSANANFVLESVLYSLKQGYPENITLDGHTSLDKEFLSTQDLLVLSLNSWNNLKETHINWLNDLPSVLIIRP